MLPERWKQNLARMNPLRPISSETAFYPAALEIMETPAPPLGRLVSLSIMAFILIAVLWAAIGSVDIIAIAPGKVVPTARAKLIQPLEAGVIRTIHVTDGKQVKAGDLLIEIDPTISEAEINRLQAELLNKQLDIARLEAASQSITNPIDKFEEVDGATDQQNKLEKSLLRSQTEEIVAKIAGLDQQVKQSEANRSSVQAAIAKISKSIPYLKKRSSIYSYLDKKGYGSKLQALQSQQQLIEAQQELTVQQGRLAAAEAAIAGANEKRREIEADYRSNTLADLGKAKQEAQSLGDRLVQANKRFELQKLTAPVDGTVQQLAVHTEGGVVTPAQALLVVIPSEGGLEVEAAIANKDVGFVREGQKAAIKVDTFNFTRYGLIEGTVQVISQDSIAPPATPASVRGASPPLQSEGQTPFYMARIGLPVTGMNIDGKLVNLSPGMSVTAEIKTGKRKIIDYLLSPLQGHVQEALRER